jgi:hypothetical protein
VTNPRGPARSRVVASTIALLVALGARRSIAHENHPPATSPPHDIVVAGDKGHSAASADEVRHRDLSLRPRVRVGDILSVVPGLFVVQHAGGGKANQYFLRGFDADHGTDLALFVDGVPINMPSHGHGQGWIDLNFVIPELVKTLSSSKGPYVARYGDFATAGAIDLRLSDHLHESSVLVSGGNFGSARTVFMVAPELGDDWSAIVAGEASTANGPFANPEKFRKFNAFGRTTRHFGRGSVAITWMSYSGAWNASGQVPLRAVGKVPELPNDFGAIDPTQGGSTQRHQLSVSYGYRRDDDEARVLLYLTRYTFSLFSNFTYFANDAINGDQIQQTDARTVAGAHWFYRRARKLADVTFSTTIGFQARHDAIDNTLSATAARKVLDTTVDSGVAQTALGLYAEEDVKLLRWLRVVAGVRADRYDVNVRDRVDAPDGTRVSGVEGQMILSPKMSVVLSPAPFVDLFLNYGRGFHSNDARGAIRRFDGRPTVTLLATADGYETGTRIRPVSGLELAAAVFRLDLESETVWVGDEGRTVARGPTRRIGAELEARMKLTRWLFLDADATFARATFVENAGNANAVALAPTRTFSAGIGFKHPGGTFGSLRVRSIAARPATEDRSLTADGWTIVDASIGHRIGAFEFAADVRNVLNTRYREVQFANESRLPSESEPVRDIHFTPGWPFTALVRVAAYF